MADVKVSETGLSTLQLLSFTIGRQLETVGHSSQQHCHKLGAFPSHTDPFPSTLVYTVDPDSQLLAHGKTKQCYFVNPVI